MNRPVRILNRARADVDEQFNWLVGRSLQGAISWYLAFGRAVDIMGASPESYPLAPESERLQCELRQALFKTRRGRNYRIIFQVNEDAVTILRVRGPAQAPMKRREMPRE
jgi:plasmid stabilization system protein ParE